MWAITYRAIYLPPFASFNSSLPVQVNLNLDSGIHSPSAGSGAKESGANRPPARRVWKMLSLLAWLSFTHTSVYLK